MRVLYTGSSGFIAGFAIPHILSFGNRVIGIDDHSKYGPGIPKEFDNHREFMEYSMDLSLEKNAKNLASLIDFERITHVVMGAAKIGGIGYFNRRPYWLQTVNDRINSITLDAVIQSQSKPRVVYVSSSMVFERANHFPTSEDMLTQIPIPITNYGMQKLTGEYYLQGAIREHGIVGSIIRPFNCVGVGEYPEIDENGEFLFGQSHVIPDLCVKMLRNPDEIEIFGNGMNVRAYTNGRDLAKAIYAVLVHGYNGQSYNASTDETASVQDLIRIIAKQMNVDMPFVRTSHSFPHDVMYRVGDSSRLKALGWRAEVTLDESIAEVLQYCKDRMGVA